MSAARVRALIRAGLLVLALGAAGTQAPPEQVVAGLSQDAVGITADFTGSEIIIYGAVRREAPIPPGDLDVIVTLEAPARAVTVRRKERVAGIWINTEAVPVGAAPGFYAVASSRPLAGILGEDEDATYRITPARAIRSFAGPLDVENPEAFTQALLRIRTQEGLYRSDEDGVTLVDDTLFRADLSLPANLVEGLYKARIFLLRDGRVVDAYQSAIEVHKVGLERWLDRLARQNPLIYGLMSLALAVAAGWGASALVRVLKR